MRDLRPLYLWNGVFVMAFKRRPLPGGVRRVISPGNSFRGVTTNKRGRLIQFESEQERKQVLLLERDATGAGYVS
jgi:hypothetical protein